VADGAARVISVDSLITGSLDNLRELARAPGFTAVTHDIIDGLSIEGQVDFIFNLASPASPIDYARHWLETMRVGALGTEHALHLAEQKKAVLIHASTSEVYGDPLVHPQTEDYLGNVDCTGPRAVYDEAKRYAEALIGGFRRSRGVATRVVRIFNTYGPRMRLNDGRVVPAFVAQALRDEPFTIFGDGSQTRSFCYVTDLIDGIVRLALSDVVDPVNLGNPDEMTVLEFAEAVRVAAGGKGAKPRFQPLPQGDPRQRRPDVTRARRLLGWEPRVSLEEGLRATIAYFRTVATRRTGTGP
jgi:dTDP-glucose 4,6-dehydratase